MDATDPSTGELVASFDEHSPTEVDAALDRATDAFPDWSSRSLRHRAKRIQAAGEILKENKRDYATTMTREMGKPITQSIAEVEKCALACDHYAEYADTYLAPEHYPSPPGSTVKTVYEPLGPVLAVMPWNFPFWQVFRFAAPYLTAGNVGLLKHASNVPSCAKTIEDVFREAGYPEGVFQSVMIPSERVGDVLADERVRAATLTGSSRAGRDIASTAGDHLKKTVLELGGSDPYVVLEDADVETAAETGAWARNQNAGQSCIAAKRFVVVDAVYDEFLEQFVEAVESLVVGDPMDEDTDIGPLAREDLLDDLEAQVSQSIDAGATVETGGEPLDRGGAFFSPTVLTDIPSDCPVDTAEVFGPVAAVYRVADEAEAIAKANDTEFGLGASIWTTDLDRADRLASEIDAGCVYVNKLVTSDPRVPFGGVKDSGYGRELSEAGIKEFLNRKTVWLSEEPENALPVE